MILTNKKTGLSHIISPTMGDIGNYTDRVILTRHQRDIAIDGVTTDYITITSFIKEDFEIECTERSEECIIYTTKDLYKTE